MIYDAKRETWAKHIELRSAALAAQKEIEMLCGSSNTIVDRYAVASDLADAFRTVRFNMLDWATKVNGLCSRPVPTFVAAMEQRVNELPESALRRSWRIPRSELHFLEDGWCQVFRDTTPTLWTDVARLLLASSNGGVS